MKTLSVMGNHNGKPRTELPSVEAPRTRHQIWPSLAAVMSVPRLGFMDNFFCIFHALLGDLQQEAFLRLPEEIQAEIMELSRRTGVPVIPRYEVPIRKFTGAFWGQCLTRTIQDSIERDATELIMTIDYDTIFTSQTLIKMLDIMATHPEIDAIAPIQMHRVEPRPLFSMKDENGRQMIEVPADAFNGDFTKIHTAHMGCMIFRVKALAKCKKPYFLNVPDKNGGWDAGRLDEDTYFWETWAAAGNNLYLANRCPVGHYEGLIRWPSETFEFIDQHPNEFYLKGAPEGVWK